MSVLEQIRRCRASRRTVESTGASRATASKNARTSPVPSSSAGTTRARIRAATGDAGWPTRSRSRRQPAGSVQSTAERTPVAPSLSSVSAQPAPACGLRTVHRRADAGRAEPEQRLARVAVVARYEGDGRDSGKLAYEPGHRRELVAAAGVDREDERVHPLPPGRPQRVPERAGVDGC